MTIHEMAYQGLNLLDEIRTVELAINEAAKEIHIYDIEDVVQPAYHFTKKQYELSDGFFKLMTALRAKQYFVAARHLSDEQWIAQITWYFYSANKTIKVYADSRFDSYSLSTLPEAVGYGKYLRRLK